MLFQLDSCLKLNHRLNLKSTSSVWNHQVLVVILCAWKLAHIRSAPDSQRYNNYNAQGNVNPYSGERGTQRHEFSNPPVQQIQPHQNPYPQQRRGY